MFGNSHSFRGPSPNARKAVPHQRVFRVALALILALGIGSPGASPAAHAAPRANTRIIYSLSARRSLDPLCVGGDYTATVRLLKQTDITPLQGTSEFDVHAVQGLDGQWVEGTVKDASIATLTPARILTGWALGELGDSPGEAIFSFHAIKAGSTVLEFTATINDRDRNGPVSKTIKVLEPIKVVNCEYRVTMIYIVQQSGPGYFSMLNGNLDTLLKRTHNDFQGTGTLDTTRIASIQGCSFSSSGYKNPTTFTGTAVAVPQGEEMQLTIQYAPGSHTDFVSCPRGSGGATETIDPSGYLVTSATFPENGGTKSFPVDFAHWSGTLIIIVAPVEASST